MSKTEAPIIVTVCGSTTDEVRAKLVELAKQFGYEDRQESLPFSPPLTLPNHGAPQLAEKNVMPVCAPTTSEPAHEVFQEPAKEVVKEEKRGRHAKDCDCAKCAAKKPEKSRDGENDLTPSPSEEKAPETASKDIVMLRMQSLLNLFPSDKPKSMAKLREVLALFGATKLTELKEESYAGFVKAADSALKSA